MARIDLVLPDKDVWVKVFDPRDQTLFVAIDDSPEIGELVRVDLVVGTGGPKVILRGRVIARRDKADGELSAGCTIALGGDEREKINYLNGFVRGGLLDLRERRRLPVRLRVTYGGIEGPCESFSRDLNEEGIFVVADNPLPEDSELHLFLYAPGSPEPLSLSGRVSHTVVVEDDDVPGMGIRFKVDDATSTRLAELVDTLEKAFLEGSLPDECLI